LLLVDHVQTKGLKSATDVEAGAAADFDSGHDFGVGVVFVREEQDASAFDGADAGGAFAVRCSSWRRCFWSVVLGAFFLACHSVLFSPTLH
jgi:hypothetical protein